MLLGMLLGTLLVSSCSAASVPRNVRIDGQRFVVAATGASIQLAGPNVVVKGPPWLPSVEGETVCDDVINDQCKQNGSCSSCMTFNQADVDFIKSRGWNTIRLGASWAGAQPRDEDALDADFLQRLHAILDLTDRNGIHVLLDNHGDQVGSLGCGVGVPAWFQQKAAPDLVGKPLQTAEPYNLVDQLSISSLNNVCGDDEAAWAEFAGNPNYYLLNSCCQALNSDAQAVALGFTEINQKTINFLFDQGPGREDFVRFWRLLATEVKQHPSAFGAELMNEPVSIRRRVMYETWKACAEAINAIIPDMSVALADTAEAVESAVVGQSLKLPDNIFDLVSPDLDDVDIGIEVLSWIAASQTVFYAWHWYGAPSSITDAIETVWEMSESWNVPNFATEFFDCAVAEYAYAADIPNTYWHYSSYCNSGKYFGYPRDTFGACVLGWMGGSPTRCSPVAQSPNMPTIVEDIERLRKTNKLEELCLNTSRLTWCNVLIIDIMIACLIVGCVVVGCLISRRSSASYRPLGMPYDRSPLPELVAWHANASSPLQLNHFRYF
jgi:hypothetical protein